MVILYYHIINSVIYILDLFLLMISYLFHERNFIQGSDQMIFELSVQLQKRTAVKALIKQ